MEKVYRSGNVIITPISVKKGKKEFLMSEIKHIEVTHSEIYDFLNRGPNPINVKITFSTAPTIYREKVTRKDKKMLKNKRIVFSIMLAEVEYIQSIIEKPIKVLV